MSLTDADVAGGWASVALQVGSASAQGVLLVQPLPEGEEHGRGCVASRLSGSSSNGGDTACSDCAAASSTAADTEGASRQPVASGRIGDCCSEEGPSHGSSSVTDRVGSSTASGNPSAASQAAAAAAALCCSHSQGRPSYYGVVVQGGGGGPEGCYLLKTTHMMQPALGCACSQYVLTRVSKGPSLQEQFTRSWLV